MYRRSMRDLSLGKGEHWRVSRAKAKGSIPNGPTASGQQDIEQGTVGCQKMDQVTDEVMVTSYVEMQAHGEGRALHVGSSRCNGGLPPLQEVDSLKHMRLPLVQVHDWE